MLKSCKYCGRIHPRGYICPKKPKQAKHRNSKTSGFRKTHTWQKKREQIVRRDFHLCRVCNEGSYGVFGVPGLDQELSVHHIEPLEERFDLRLDDGNLLTCCSRHHRMADDGDIPRDYLHELAEASPGGIEVSRWIRVKTNSGPLNRMKFRNGKLPAGREEGGKWQDRASRFV